MSVDKEKIAAKYIACTCGEMYKSRDMVAPDCAFCNEDWDEPMTEYAKEVAIDFFNDVWKYMEVNGVKLADHFTPETETLFEIYMTGDKKILP